LHQAPVRAGETRSAAAMGRLRRAAGAVMSDIRKRMAHVRAKLANWTFKYISQLPGEPSPSINVERVCFPAESHDALRRAREYFGLRSSHDLALAMATVLFGKNEKGHPKGTKTWTGEKYLHLACALLQFRDGGHSDAEICRRIGKGGDIEGEFKNYNPEHLR